MEKVYIGYGLYLVLRRGRVFILSNEDILRYCFWEIKGKFLNYKIKVIKFKGV